MTLRLGGAVCLVCRTPLREGALVEGHVHCDACPQRYPVLFGSIPIVVRDPLRWVARCFIQYSRHLDEQAAERKKVEEGMGKVAPERMAMLSAFAEAIRRNAAVVGEVRDELGRYVSAAELWGALSDTTAASYAHTLSYLRRDWAWTAEGEDELSILEGALAPHLAGAETAGGPLLVLGAGAGRIAYDLSRAHGRVVAIDSSVAMARHFDQLLGGKPIEFFELSANSLRRNTDHIRRHVASLCPPGAGPLDPDQAARARERIAYLVAGARHIPLPDRSVSAVVSVFFTDVLPLDHVLPEVKRVLRPGGRFVHLGPLEYHFVDIVASLPAEEVVAALRAQGFSVEAQGEAPSFHLRSAASLSATWYANWLLVARLDEAPPPALPPPRAVPVIGPETTLRLAKTLRYELTGELAQGGEQITSARLVLPSGDRYRGAASVLDILRLIDGVRTNQEVIEALALTYDLSGDGARAEVLDVLRLLVSQGALCEA